MKFRRALQRYGRTPEPVTPYQRAAQMWDERIGSARVQARNWRLMAFGGLALSIGLASGLVWQSLQSRVVPYVVAVDRLGEAQLQLGGDAGSGDSQERSGQNRADRFKHGGHVLDSPCQFSPQARAL